MIFGHIPKPTYNLGAFSVAGHYNEHFITQENDEYETLPTTLQEVLNNAKTSGVYRMWSSFNNRPVRLFVHKEVDGKKWALVLRYNHKAGTNPDVNHINQGDFPIPPDPNKLTAFNDESKTFGWGHLTPTYLSQLEINEVAFFGITSAHNRTICFTLNNEGSGYVQGKGFFRYELAKPYTMFNYTPSANLPHSSNACFDNSLKGLTEPPFAKYGDAYWSIGVDNLRWEVDNCLDPRFYQYLQKPSNKLVCSRPLEEIEEEQMYNFDTLHMVFVR